MIYHLLWRRYIPINLLHSRWYITDIHRLDMVHILYIMLNFDEVYIDDIPPAVSIATWYIALYTMLLWKQQKDIHLIKIQHDNISNR